MAGRPVASELRGGLILSAMVLAGLAYGVARTEAAESAQAAPSRPSRAVAEDGAPSPPRIGPGESVQPAPRTTPRRQASPQPSAAPTPPDQGLPPNPGLLASLFGATAPSPPSSRLFDSPNMFGDSFGLGGDLIVGDVMVPAIASTDLPLAGGSRRVKVAENNKALPQDRVYFLYNHFQNALQVDPLIPVGPPRDFSVDRYSFGVEKTFGDGQWSVEMRMPFTGDMDASSFFVSVDGGHVGNLAVLLKRLVYQNDATALAIGLGIDTPTGDDVRGATPFTSYVVSNEATHLLPYVGILRVPSDLYFYQAFVQVDVPLNGNSIFLPTIGTSLGRLHEQTLLYLDLELGRWLYRNPRDRWLTGLASVVEFHYTTTLQDADSVTAIVGPTLLFFGNSANRMDVPNLTVGLHAEIANRTLLRVGGVFPLDDDADDRFFDAELQVQVERRF